MTSAERDHELDAALLLQLFDVLDQLQQRAPEAERGRVIGLLRPLRDQLTRTPESVDVDAAIGQVRTVLGVSAFDTLIAGITATEVTSLGTPAVRAVRRQTPPEMIAAVLARTTELDPRADLPAQQATARPGDQHVAEENASTLAAVVPLTSDTDTDTAEPDDPLGGSTVHSTGHSIHDTTAAAGLSPFQPSSVSHVQDRISMWRRVLAQDEREGKRASNMLTFLLITVPMLLTLAALGFHNVLGAWASVIGWIGMAAAAVYVVRGNLKLRRRAAARQRLALSPPRPPLPSHISSARVPMEKLHSAEDTMTQRLAQLGSPVPTSMATDYIELIKSFQRIAQETAAALRSVSSVLQVVERARDTAPPLERAPLIESVRVLRIQLMDGVDRYCALVVQADEALEASAQFQNPAEILDDVTIHMTSLASTIRDMTRLAAAMLDVSVQSAYRTNAP